MSSPRNIDPKTVEGFGEEWAAFDQGSVSDEEHRRLFERYFSVFPFESLPAEAEGFDLGCGTGRWAELAAQKVGTLHCIDPAEKALAVARRRLEIFPNVHFHNASVDEIPLPDASQDFGYSLGVLHHVPDTEAAMASCTRKLKAGAPFLVYLYYSFDNRPRWFRMLWRLSEMGRVRLSRWPFRLKKAATTVIAATIYWPLARTAWLAEKAGADVRNFPLSYYRETSYYTMRTDALDRFGTRLEQRFKRAEIEGMMTRCGLEEIRFCEDPPFWVAVGLKRRLDA